MGVTNEEEGTEGATKEEEEEDKFTKDEEDIVKIKDQLWHEGKTFRKLGIACSLLHVIFFILVPIWFVPSPGPSILIPFLPGLVMIAIDFLQFYFITKHPEKYRKNLVTFTVLQVVPILLSCYYAGPAIYLYVWATNNRANYFCEHSIDDACGQGYAAAVLFDIAIDAIVYVIILIYRISLTKTVYSKAITAYLSLKHKKAVVEEDDDYALSVA